ncbi:MAG: biotin--[acetyl-CoA-carboxylase] ligase [Nitrospinota bacterium]|nr:biotin--[acetyl-CoA-carboxylase] ligase [Nitrospinota bacterium]
MPYSSEDQNWIRDQLHTQHVGREIITYTTVESTNDLAKELVTAWDKEGTVILADCQTQGKGRSGRTWYSEENVGIYLSVLLKPGLAPEQIAPITLIAGVALTQALNEFSRTRPVLKWPNDILLNGKKVAGILTENHKEDGHSGIILGIGINVNHTRFPISLQHIATSLAMENGESFERPPLIAAFLNHLDREYSGFLEEGPSHAALQWNQHSEMFGKHISLKQGTETYSGTAMKLDDEGRLVILLDSGEEMAFVAGEITSME